MEMCRDLVRRGKAFEEENPYGREKNGRLNLARRVNSISSSQGSPLFPFSFSFFSPSLQKLKVSSILSGGFATVPTHLNRVV